MQKEGTRQGGENREIKYQFSYEMVSLLRSSTMRLPDASNEACTHQAGDDSRREGEKRRDLTDRGVWGPQ